MHAHDAPARLPVKKWPWLATSPVALQNTPKKATRSTSKRHSQIISCEILEEKISILSSHRSTAQIPLKAGLIFSSFSVLFDEQLVDSQFLIKHMIQILSFRPVSRSTMMDIISVSLSTIFLLSLRIFFLSENLWFHVKRLQINQKKLRKASLKIPWKYQWICQHGALWWLGCALARKTQWTVLWETPG